MRFNTVIASICVAAASLACVSVEAFPYVAPPRNTYTPIQPPAKPQPQTYRGNINDVSFAMACEVNRIRAYKGLPLLGLAADLNDAAYRHSIVEANYRLIAHDGLSDGSFMNRLVNYAIKWNPPAENVAAGNAGPIKTFLQWFYSPGHYANMMGPYTHTGCARARGSDGVYYWTQLFSNTPSVQRNIPNCSAYYAAYPNTVPY
jgi:uncharacterized protein YkwD